MTEPVSADGVARRIADVVAGEYAGGHKVPEMTSCPDCGGAVNDTDKDSAGYWCPECHMYYQLPEPLLDPDIAAAINQGWRNGLLELAVWCEQQVRGFPDEAVDAYRRVAAHARERAR